jgi:D-arabinose 1-dehydrogenase-like Zn-dependent alcohol dehydrogenase
MKACVLVSPAPVESNPLRIVELPKPKPAAGQVLEIPIHTEVRELALEEANEALNALKNDAIRGAAVLRI